MCIDFFQYKKFKEDNMSEKRTWIRVKSDEVNALDKNQVRTTLKALQQKLAPLGVTMKNWAKICK